MHNCYHTFIIYRYYCFVHFVDNILFIISHIDDIVYNRNLFFFFYYNQFLNFYIKKFRLKCNIQNLTGF